MNTDPRLEPDGVDVACDALPFEEMQKDLPELEVNPPYIVYAVTCPLAFVDALYTRLEL